MHRDVWEYYNAYKDNRVIDQEPVLWIGAAAVS